MLPRTEGKIFTNGLPDTRPQGSQWLYSKYSKSTSGFLEIMAYKVGLISFSFTLVHCSRQVNTPFHPKIDPIDLQKPQDFQVEFWVTFFILVKTNHGFDP